MNSSGQTLMISIIFAAMIFFAGVLFINFIKGDIDTARGASVLNCGAAGNSDGVKVTCLVVDLALPYFIVIFLSVAGGLILERLLI